MPEPQQQQTESVTVTLPPDIAKAYGSPTMVVTVPKGASDSQVRLAARMKFQSQKGQSFEQAQQDASLTQQAEQRLSSAPQEALTGALPNLAAAAGTMALGPEAGPIARTGMATLMGAGGQAAGDIATGSTAPTSGTEALRLGISGGVQGAFQGLAEGLGKLYGTLYRRWGDKVTSKKAGELIANEISSPQSTGTVGENIQKAFDVASNKAGAEKAAELAKFVQANPNARTSFDKSLALVNEKLSEAGKSLAGKTIETDVAKQTGSEKAYLALREIRDNLKQQAFESNNQGLYQGVKSLPMKSNLEQADETASKVFKYAQGQDRSLPKKDVSEISRAIYQDVNDALGDAAPAYKAASGRYRVLMDMTRQNTLKNVFTMATEKRVPIDQVIDVMAKAPEESVAAIQSLAKDTPVVAKEFRRSLFENMFTSGKLQKIPSANIDEIFGSSAGKIKGFVQALDDAEVAAQKSGITKRLVAKAGDKMGIIINDARGPVLQIPASRLRELVDNPTAIDILTKGLKQDAKGGQAANVIRLLTTAIQGGKAAYDKYEEQQ